MDLSREREVGGQGRWMGWRLGMVQELHAGSKEEMMR